jgi:hypothetical protein
MSKHATDVHVAAGIVLHEIAGDEYNIGRPGRGLPRIGKRGLERGECCDPAQGFRLAPVKVRVGELNDAQNTHDFDITSRILSVTSAMPVGFLGSRWPDGAFKA